MKTYEPNVVDDVLSKLAKNKDDQNAKQLVNLSEALTAVEEKFGEESDEINTLVTAVLPYFDYLVKQLRKS